MLHLILELTTEKRQSTEFFFDLQLSVSLTLESLENICGQSLKFLCNLINFQICSR